MVSPNAIPVRRLRPAIEVALRVAREGEEADPVEPAPAALRRYLSFAKLPAPALEATRRVVDDDPVFRRRVAEATTAEDVGDVGWLWLTRPDGWEVQIGEVIGSTDRRHDETVAAKGERSLRRRIAELEEAVRRAEAAAAADRAQAAATRAELDTERARRRAIGLAAEESQLARSTAEAEVARLTAELAKLADERDHAIDRAARLERDLRDARLRAEPDAIDAGGAGFVPAEAGSAGPAPTGPDLDREALARAIAAATAALAEASSLVAEASPLVAGPPVDAVRQPRRTSPPPAPRSLGPSARAARPARSSPRQRLKLPGGVLDDGAEAAEHLVRVPHVLLLVDGYNISNALAPGKPLTEQRTRLIDALSELQARAGTSIEVVFDGAPGPDPWISGGRPSVHVQFSPAGVEADDVLVDLIASLPPSRPVILATSDRGLRDRARRLGANLLGARQLLAVMRR
jgi:predicted RNA-binding protein with PIN domain